MTKIQDISVARRDVLKGSGALVVGFSIPASLTAAATGEAQAAAALARPLSPSILDS